MRRVVLICVMATIATAVPIASAAAAPSLRLSGAASARTTVCGVEREALTADAGARLTAHVRGGRAATIALDRCEGAGWRRIARVKARRGGRSAPLPLTEPGEYRVRHRRTSRYAVLGDPVVSLPVTFAVRNVNRTAAACPADGERYELRGRIVARRHALARARSVTLYLHELSFGAFFWHMPDLPEYDYAGALARAGHVSVVIDRLGYGDSPRPPGLATCLGAQADMAHQVVQSLRAGSYVSPAPAPIAFERVGLAGHSIGGMVAELAAAQFGGVDALALFAWADAGLAAETMLLAVAQGAKCVAGGDAGAGGYAYLGSERDFRRLQFADAEPAVADRVTSLRSRDPCGDAASQPQALVANNLVGGGVRAPVLVVFGERDPVFAPGAGAQQAARFAGATLITVPGAAHALTFARGAPGMRERVGAWLREHGL